MLLSSFFHRHLTFKKHTSQKVSYLEDFKAFYSHYFDLKKKIEENFIFCLLVTCIGIYTLAIMFTWEFIKLSKLQSFQ